MAINQKRIGRVLAEVRQRKALTQRMVAEHTGLTINYLSLVEHGQRALSSESLNRISDVLGVPAELLILLAADLHLRGNDGEAFAELIEPVKEAIWELIDAEAESATK
jgi:transcriptional regulator with XRE-family HTH domain